MSLFSTLQSRLRVGPPPTAPRGSRALRELALFPAEVEFDQVSELA